MQSNQYFLTNSQFAQVEAYQKQISVIFDKEFPFATNKQFYTNLRTVSRFSIAREFDKEKTLLMWRNWVKWHTEYRPDLISAEEEIIKKIHTSEKYRYAGFDKEGCPILVIRMRFHVKGLANADQNLRYLLFMLEHGVKLAQEKGTYKVSVIYDRRDVAESDDVSKESMKKFMPILNDCYPETLKAFYVLGANWLYRAMWKVVSLFISKKTEEKINLLQDVSDLTKFINQNNLPIEYGGPLKFADTTREIPLTNQKEVEDKELVKKMEKEFKQY